MLEERVARPTRQTCRIDASIRLADGGNLIACVVEDISSKGARLRIPAGLWLPPRFSLRFLVDDNLHRERDVELRWKMGTAAGVRFELAWRPNAA